MNLGKDIAKDFLFFLLEESDAAKEAKKRGLKYNGFGRWTDKGGNVVAKTEDGKLVPVKGGDTKSAPTPSTKMSPGGSKGEEKSKGKMTLVGVYSGRFQPFGRHHFAAYKQLEAVTGANTYIATSDKTDDEKSPLNFNEKRAVIAKYGIPTNRIVKEKSPYKPEAILSKYDPKTTALVVIFGAKDAGRLGSGGKYYVPYKGDANLEGYEDKGYYIVAKHESVTVGGKELSGTQIRTFLGSHKISSEKKKKLFKAIFGWYDPKLFDVITKKVGAITPENESVLSSEEYVPRVGDKVSITLENGETYHFTVKKNDNLLTEGGDYVICQECKKQMKQIQYRHLRYAHNMTMEQYTNKYPNTLLISESAKNTGLKNPMSDPENRKHFLDAVQSKEYREKQRILSTGRLHSDESKLKMSQNNAMHNPEYRQRVSEAVTASYKNPTLMELRKKQFTAIRNSEKYKTRMYELGIWRRPELKEGWERYYESVKLITEQNFSKYFYTIVNAHKRSREYHLDHIVPIDYGFYHNVPPEIIGHQKNLRVVHHSVNESKGYKLEVPLNELLTSIRELGHPNDTRVLLLCGGAYGHMRHPFDDNELTFGDLKEIILLSLQGHLDKEAKVMEKLDGQALSVSWVNNKLVAARNKGHLKNYGENALGVAGIKRMFAGRGPLERSFGKAMEDLQSAINGLTEKQKEKIFQNGKNFMALEVVYPETENVMPYDQAVLVFHGVIIYDNNGNPIGENKEYARVLAGMIKQINADVQKTYKIAAPAFLSIPSRQDFSEKSSYFISKVDRLKNKLGLKDSDTLALYHQRWWENFISKKASSMKYPLSNNILTALVKRWAFDDKSNKIIDILKGISSLEFAEWIKTFDKEDHEAQVKENMQPFENIFLELGAEVLSNASGFLAANPNKSVQTVRKKLESTIKQLRGSKDLSKLNKLKTELQRIQSLGGFDKIVPAEGLVFTYNGKTYKLTGAFAPANQILGMLKYKGR